MYPKRKVDLQAKYYRNVLTRIAGRLLKKLTGVPYHEPGGNDIGLYPKINLMLR
jgi:hypothetical protein